MKGGWRDWSIGALLLGALLLWVESRIGWGVLLAPWREMAPLQLLWLFSLSLLSYLFRAIRIYDYFQARLAGHFPATLRLTLLHNFANNLLPMRAGEAFFPLLMKRYFGHSMTDSLLSLLWIRGLDLHLLVSMALLAMFLRQQQLLWLLLVLLWLGTLLLVYPLRAPLLNGLQTRQGKIAGLLRRVLLNLPQHQPLFFRIYLWTLLTWLSKIAAFVAILLHFLPLPLWQGLLGVMGSELSSILPVHGIAGSGSYELAMVAVLVPLGVQSDAVLAGAVNLHLFLLGVTLLLGALALLLPRADGREGSRDE